MNLHETAKAEVPFFRMVWRCTGRSLSLIFKRNYLKVQKRPNKQTNIKNKQTKNKKTNRTLNMYRRQSI